MLHTHTAPPPRSTESRDGCMGEQGNGNRGMGTGEWEQGNGNREMGTGEWEQGNGNRGMGTRM